MFTNSLLIILSVTTACHIISYLREETINTRARRYTLVLGIFVFCWEFGYALMGITDSLYRAPIYRAVGVVGIVGFVVTELFLLIGQAYINRDLEILLHFVLICYGISELIIYCNPAVNIYVRPNDRMAYTSMLVWNRVYHLAFLFVTGMGIVLLCMFIKKRITYKRERKYVNFLLASNLFVMASMIPDNLLPLFGVYSWPSSAFGAFITYALIRYVDKKYSTFAITKNGMTNYIYDHAPIGIMALDLHFKLVAANRYVMRLFGIDEADKGIDIAKLLMITEEEGNEIRKVLRSEGSYEGLFTTWNAQINILVKLHVERDENGYPYCVFGTVADQTKEDEMLVELSDLNEARTLFLANMSHEIRTPVNTVMGMNEMILRSTKDPRIKNYALNIKSSSNLLVSIINDILDFSKLETGEFTLSQSNYSLSTVIKDAVSIVEEKTYKKGLSLSVEVEDTLPSKLYGDEVRIKQIIVNLLTNAVKYTDYGSITIKVAGANRSPENIDLCIDVIDTGKGISTEDQRKLFEAFRRFDEKKNRDVEGTGLGLSITSSLVSAMNGTISVESDYGKGSDFRVVIPQKITSNLPIGDYRDGVEVYDNENVNANKIIAPNARVLVVDDNDLNLQVAALLLEDTKVSVDTALSGIEALEYMKKEKYDIIFLDHMMPEMDGIELLNIMKTERLQEGVPVIVLTANAIAGARQMYLDYGFDDYISKPIECDKVNTLLKKWLPEELIMKEEVEG